MTSIHDLKLGSNTLEVLEVILNSLEAFPNEIAKLDLSKFTQIASSIDSSYQNIQTAGANITAMKNAINQTKKSITFEEKDTTEVSNKFLRIFKIEDFPAILLFKDEKLKVRKIGSVPSIVVLRWIDVNFD